MPNTNERFNNLLNKAYNTQQNTNERFNRLINNANNRIIIENQRRKKEQEEIENERKKVEQEKQRKTLNIDTTKSFKDANKDMQTYILNNPDYNKPIFSPLKQTINNANNENINKNADNLTNNKAVFNLEQTTLAPEVERELYLQKNRTLEEKIGLQLDKINKKLQGYGQIVDSTVSNAMLGAEKGMYDLLSYGNVLPERVQNIYDNANIVGKTALSILPPTGSILLGNRIKDSLPEKVQELNDEQLEKTEQFINNQKNDINMQIQKKQEKVNKQQKMGMINETEGKIGKKATEIAPSIGNNLVGMGLSAVNPALGTTYFVGSSAGSYYDDALQRGMDEDEAFKYGTIMGIMEGVTEKIALGRTTKAGLMLGKGEVGKALTETGISLGENFIQEAIMEPIQETSAMLVGGKDKADFSNMGQRMLQSGIDGALSAIILEGATVGVQSAVNVQEKIENGQQVSEKEIQKALFDIQTSRKVDIEAKFKQEIQYQVQKASKEYAEKNNIPKLQQNPIKNQNINQQQQINQVDNKNDLNQNVEGQSETKFSKILNNQKLPMQSYVYEKSDNVKIDNLRQQANKYFNNSQEAHNYVDMLEKIITDKNITINFDTNLGNDINGKYENDVITINPNSSRAGEFLAIHELTHAIGTDSMIKMIDNYRKSNAEFDSQVQKLLQKYNKSEISEEALADIAGQLFGNQEYINNLSKTNPNMFKRIYNEIKYLWHQFRGYKNQDQFVDDLMFKWEQAYRNNEQLNNAKYSKQENTNLPKIDYTDDKNLTREVFNKYNTFYSKNQPKEQNRFNDFINKHYSDFNSASNYYVSQAIDNGSLVTMWLNVDDNLVKLTTTKEGNKLYIDELYVEKQKQGTGTKVVNMLKDYANKAGLTIETSKELTTAKGFWDKALNKVSQETTNLPQTDNKGNVLSKQQQEYFKDSKVRDENGNLKVVYHGTPYQFNEFNYSKLGENTSSLGAGFYFTDQQNTGKEYTRGSGELKTVYLDIKKPMTYGKTTMTKNEYKKFIQEIDKATNGTYLTDYDGIENALMEYDYGGDDIDLVMAVQSASGLSWKNIYNILRDTTGYDGIISEKGFVNDGETIYVAFNPEQIKNVNNQNPTSNPDIRYSKNSNTWQEYLEKEFPAKGTRTNMQNIKNGVLPTKETINQKKEQNKAETKLPPKVSANNQYKDNTTKVRKHYKSIIESANTTPEAKAIAKELMGTDTYIPETNKGELERADEKIMNSTPESELNSLMSRATVGEKITPVDIAVGERLIQYYSKIGDGAKLQDAIQATAMAGTTAGQTVQAMSLLNHMTPQGQAVWLQRSVDKMNNKLKKTRGKNAQQFTLTDDMLQKIVSSENEKQLAENLDEVYKELGQQVSKSTMEKIDAWRYFSMLANPRTHIRNILGNFAMARVQVLKNKVAGVTEAVVSKANKNMERTHTIVPASKEVRQFAKADINNVTDRLGLTEGKLNPQTRLENNMKTFKRETLNKTIGKLFDLNNKALEVEDGWGLKAGYAKALAEYMTANKLKPDTITDAQLSKARNYAVQQAKEATFHQENQLASLVNQLSNRNKFAKFGVDAVLPFKKTPMNIAKTGIEYSPVGLAKSMVLDTAKLRKGNITVNQYIDNISKGLTGTGIGLVGYVLAEAGILKASGGDDDDKEKYEEGRGKQAFSIQIGDNTYSLDWLAPTAIPLFIGAEISALNKATNETKTSNSSDENSKYNQILKTTTNVLDAFTNSMNPMMEMSMLSGLASTLRSYEQGATQGITAMGTNALKSYVNQFFPTAMGQVAKTMDEYERSTTSTKSGILPKAVDSTKNQIMAKVPGLRQMLPSKTDVWGNDMKQPENVVQRALENAVLPYTRKEVNNNDVDQELVRLYEERGEKAVLPSSSLSKDLTFSGEKYKMTSEEFAKYKKDYGSKSYSLINDLVNSSDYNKLSDEDKQQALENVYKYAKEYAKDQYAKANDIDYKKDTMFKTVQEMEKSGNVSSYFNYLAKTDGMKEKEKMNVLVKASYSNNDKKLIYTNTIGSDDSLYNNAMKYTGININEYLKYKQQEFTSDKTDDGTVDGKSVSGSKKAKVYDYVNQMKITGEQRMLLLGTQYKLTNSERAILANYVANLKITKNQKLEIYKKLQGFTVYKDGRVIY